MSENNHKLPLSNNSNNNINTNNNNSTTTPSSVPISFSLFPVNNDIVGDSFEHFDLHTPPLISPENPKADIVPQQRQQQIPKQPQPVACSQKPVSLQQNANASSNIVKLRRETNVRNYELYEGNSFFFCGGRLLTSRAFWVFCFSVSVIVVPSVLFLVFTCPWLWLNLSPAAPIVFAYLLVLTFASMVKTSWTDPGIIPRNLDRIPPSDDHFYRNSSDNDTVNPESPPKKDVIINGIEVGLKYCETCYIYRPPRASHCRQCDNCVENEDHHCIWLNNCIGKRNYRSFFTFITSCTLLCIFVVSFSLVQLISLCLSKYNHVFIKAIDQAPVSFGISILCTILMLPIGCLTGYHVYLASKGVTTHEQLRAEDGEQPIEEKMFGFDNPIRNMYHVFCKPHSKSYIGRRKFAEEEFEHNGPVADSNITTVNDDLGQTSTLETTLTSNIPLQDRQKK